MNPSMKLSSCSGLTFNVRETQSMTWSGEAEGNRRNVAAAKLVDCFSSMLKPWIYPYRYINCVQFFMPIFPADWKCRQT